MSSNEKYDKNRHLIDSDIDDEGGKSGTGSSGGQGGKIDFVDFLAADTNKRDDLLTDQEKKHLLAAHKDVHESKVKQQKEKIELKKGKITLAAHRAGLMGAGATAQFKANPELADKAQFSASIDKQVNPSSTENIADTNPEARDALLNELKYQLGYQPKPTFNPKPSGPY